MMNNAIEQGRSAGRASISEKTIPLDFSLPSEDLSKREVDIICLSASGATAKQIGGELFLSHRTVQNYFSSIKEKLGARNMTEAVVKAIFLGVILLPHAEPTIPEGKYGKNLPVAKRS